MRLSTLILATNLLLHPCVQAGIEPGSKDLGAIWFIGDSIAQSNADGDGKGSPRKSLYELLTANGYTFSYTGHHAKNVDGLPASGSDPAENLYHYHSGVSGILIGDASRPGFRTNLSKTWNQGRLETTKPSVILIMIGTNDVGHKHDLENGPKRLKDLVNEIYALPEIGTPTIFLATVPPNRRTGQRHALDTENVVTFNATIPAIVEDFQAQGKDVHFVDQFTPLDKDYAANMRPDNLHPNGTGNDTMARTWFRAISTLAGEGAVDSEQASSFPGEKSDFNGFDRYQVKTPKGMISVVCPKNAAPGKPWMWRSMFWGGTSGAVGRVTKGDLQLIEDGYHVVIAPGDVSGHPKGNDVIDAAYDTLTKDYGFSKTLSMASMSRETLALFRWASANPEKVESLYVDNGVCNVNSWPGGKRVPGSGSKGSGAPKSWELLKKTYGFESDEEALAAKVSPIDLLEPLAKAGVPILMVCGTKDVTVPYEENGAIMKERYEELGGSIQIIFEDKGHHPHGLVDPEPVIEFIKKNTQ